MTERDLEQMLIDALCAHCELNEQDVIVDTFEEAGLLTSNRGVRVRFPSARDGRAVFQLTIVQAEGVHEVGN